jgi:malonate-semialdehyde dehydrogenase (acetylating)/methylmalonate-semialdehyde dehydrogenase
MESLSKRVQRLQDAAKTGTPNSWEEPHAFDRTFYSAAARSRAHRARTADVFEPMTGEVQAKVRPGLQGGSARGGRERQGRPVGVGATNPQRRARVMMKFLELAQRDYDKLADLLAREHGKTVPDAKGDIQRGLEVVEFACGIPHLMKGEYTEAPAPASTSIRCANRSASSPASRRSISRR